jgi:uncharacterized membrane protein
VSFRLRSSLRPLPHRRIMERVEKEIEVDAPLTVVYNQWTQFEEFPEFMEGVTEVRQLDDRRLFWSAEILGREFDWDAEIYEQVPDTCVKWRSTSGKHNAGEVHFSPVGEKTNVRLVMEYDPEGFAEKIADTLGFISKRLETNLARFRDFIERRGRETGGWRGEIQPTRAR